MFATLLLLSLDPLIQIANMKDEIAPCNRLTLARVLGICLTGRRKRAGLQGLGYWGREYDGDA